MGFHGIFLLIVREHHGSYFAHAHSDPDSDSDSNSNSYTESNADAKPNSHAHATVRHYRGQSRDLPAAGEPQL